MGSLNAEMVLYEPYTEREGVLLMGVERLHRPFLLWLAEPLD